MAQGLSAVTPFAGRGGFGAFPLPRRQAGVNPGQLLSGFLQQGSQAGFLSPTGSPVLRSMLERRAARSAKNRLRSGDVLSRLAGLSPIQQRQAMVDIQGRVGGETSDLLGQSLLQQLLGQQEFFRGTLGQERGFQVQQQEADRARRAQERGLLGSLLGGLIPAGLGLAFGGPAGALGVLGAGSGKK